MMNIPRPAILQSKAYNPLQTEIRVNSNNPLRSIGANGWQTRHAPGDRKAVRYRQKMMTSGTDDKINASDKFISG
ncbi:hypothetical protein DPI70_23980 [Escherichia coli]|nr:hypothetical protein [Escherichia coli]